MSNIYFIDGPLNGYSTEYGPSPKDVSYYDVGSGAHYMRSSPSTFTFTDQRAAPVSGATVMGVTGPLPEVKVRGEKLMNLGQIQQFIDAARTAGYKDSHVPRVENSFSGRITALIAKS